MTPKWLHFFLMMTGRSITRLKRLLMKPMLMLQSHLKLCLSQAAQGWLKTSIFREMSIQLPAILMFTRGTSFDPQPCTNISTRDISPYARRTSDAFTNIFSISHSLQQLYPLRRCPVTLASGFPTHGAAHHDRDTMWLMQVQVNYKSPQVKLHCKKIQCCIV